MGTRGVAVGGATDERVKGTGIAIHTVGDTRLLGVTGLSRLYDGVTAGRGAVGVVVGIAAKRAAAIAVGALGDGVVGADHIAVGRAARQGVSGAGIGIVAVGGAVAITGFGGLDDAVCRVPIHDCREWREGSGYLGCVA